MLFSCGAAVVDETTEASRALPEQTAAYAPREPEPDEMPYYEYGVRYARSTLNADEAALYDRILSAALSYDTRIETDSDAAPYVYTCVFFDTPELFYLDETAVCKDGALYFNYLFDKEQAKRYADLLDGVYGSVRDELVNLQNDYERFLYIYEFIINRTKYDSAAEKLFSAGIYDDRVKKSICAIGPLTEGEAICTGYSRATQYLCCRCGIDCFTVKGFGDSVSSLHYFNLVLLDGQYYYSDTTWDDPVDAKDPGRDILTYNYFCITTDEMLRTHGVSTPVPLVRCVATENNYFVKNGLYAEDARSAAEIVWKNYSSGKREITLKLPDASFKSICGLIASELNVLWREKGYTLPGCKIVKYDKCSLVSIIFK